MMTPSPSPLNNLKEMDIVWARQRGYPLWPAVLSPCPVQPNMGKWMARTGKKVKYHGTFVGWDKQRVWLEEKDIRILKREDAGEGRKKEYVVKNRQYKIQHIEALELAVNILDHPNNPLDYLVKEGNQVEEENFFHTMDGGDILKVPNKGKKAEISKVEDVEKEESIDEEVPLMINLDDAASEEINNYSDDFSTSPTHMVLACPRKVQLTSSPPPDAEESTLVHRVVREMVTRDRVVEETEHVGQTDNFDEESEDILKPQANHGSRTIPLQFSDPSTILVSDSEAISTTTSTHPPLESALCIKPLLSSLTVSVCPPFRPDVLDGELFAPVPVRMAEEITSLGARRLVEQLDNPDKFLRSLPSLPIPEWSKINSSTSKVVKKLVDPVGHFLLDGEREMIKFGQSWEENVELCKGRVYCMGIENIDRWVIVEEDNVIDSLKVLKKEEVYMDRWTEVEEQLNIPPTPTSPLLSHPTPTSPLLRNTTATSSVLNHPTPTSPGLSHPTPTSPGLSHPTPTSPVLSRHTPTDPFLNHPAPTSPPALSHISLTNPANQKKTICTTSSTIQMQTLSTGEQDQVVSLQSPDAEESTLVPRVVNEMVNRERVVEETEREGQTGNTTSSNLPPQQPGEEVTDIESLIVPDLKDNRQAELSQISPDNSAIRRSKTVSSSPDVENHTQHGVGVTNFLHTQVGPVEETGHQSLQHQMSDLLSGWPQSTQKRQRKQRPLNAIVVATKIVIVDTPGTGSNKNTDVLDDEEETARDEGVEEEKDRDEEVEEVKDRDEGEDTARDEGVEEEKDTDEGEETARDEWEEDDTAPESEGSEFALTGRPKTYLTKMKKITQQSLEKEEKKAKYSRAVAAYRQGGFKSIANCARRYQIPRTTLRDLLASGDEYQGSGRKLHCLTREEEGEIVDHVKWRAAVGCGVDWHQLQLLVQEVLLGLKIANPERMTGYEGSGQLPNVNFIRRLAERHRLTLRSSSEISKGRQILTKMDLENWQKDTEEFMQNNPQLKEAMMDPSRIFNQDETAVEIGSSSQKVLAEVNTKVVYTISGGSREHITASVLTSADGAMVPPRLIYKGVRNMAETHLKNLSKTGLSGEWKFSVSERGYINRDLFVEVCRDLDKFLLLKNISRPVVLFIDGASPHISLSAAAFCKEKGIQPWLFKPNFTHLCQPLDLMFFCSLKRELKKLAWMWQCSPENAGQILNKYSIVVLLRQATEVCLQKKDLIPNGFRRAGIFPWNRAAPDTSKLLPGTVFQHDLQVLEPSAMPSQLEEVEKEIAAFPIPIMEELAPSQKGQIEVQDPCNPANPHRGNILLAPSVPALPNMLDMQSSPSPNLTSQLKLVPTLPNMMNVPVQIISTLQIHPRQVIALAPSIQSQIPATPPSNLSSPRLPPQVSDLQLPPNQELQLPHNQDLKLPPSQDPKLPPCQDLQLPSSQDLQFPPSQDLHLPPGREHQPPVGCDLQHLQGCDLQPIPVQVLQLPPGLDYQSPLMPPLESEIKLPPGQDLQSPLDCDPLTFLCSDFQPPPNEQGLLGGDMFVQNMGLENPQLESVKDLSTNPYWQGETSLCPKCSRRILKKFLNIHLTSCNQSLKPKTPSVLVTVPEFSLDERIIQLNRFEVVLLTPSQVKEFENQFSQRNFDLITEPLFHSWLTLKLASIPSEAEALKRVLSAHTATNIPKRQQKRKQNLPSGPPRYDPISDEWVELLTDQESRKVSKAKKKKSDSHTEEMAQKTQSSKTTQPTQRKTNPIQRNKTTNTSPSSKTTKSSPSKTTQPTPRSKTTHPTPRSKKTQSNPSSNIQPSQSIKNTQPIKSNKTTQPIQSNKTTQPTRSIETTIPVRGNKTTQPISSTTTKHTQNNKKTQPPLPLPFNKANQSTKSSTQSLPGCLVTPQFRTPLVTQLSLKAQAEE